MRHSTSIARPSAGCRRGRDDEERLTASVLARLPALPLRQRGFNDWRFVFFYALPIWAIGLALVAPLPWLLLHRRNVRSWTTATAAGAILIFIAVLATLTYGFGIVRPGSFSASTSGGAT